MTSEHNQKLIDGAIHGPGQRAHEPGSEQALFMEKLREAAKSATGNIGRPTVSDKKLAVPSESSSAVKNILDGFTVNGEDKA